MSIEVYIGNLPFETTEDEVRQLVTPHGKVKSVAMITDRGSGRFRGFCFVEMEEKAAEAAIAALDGKEVGGRKIRVNKARPRSQGQGGGKKGRSDDRDTRPLHERTSRGGSGAQGEYPYSGGNRGQGRGKDQGRGNGDTEFPFSGGGSRRNR